MSTEKRKKTENPEKMYKNLTKTSLGKLDKKTVTVDDVMRCTEGSFLSKFYNRLRLKMQGKGWINEESAQELLKKLKSRDLNKINRAFDDVLDKATDIGLEEETVDPRSARFRQAAKVLSEEPKIDKFTSLLTTQLKSKKK